MCPGCPVEDDVCLDVLVSWLAGRLFNFFYGILLCFFPLSNWAMTLHYNQVFIFSIFLPPQPKLRFKILNASSL